MANKIFVLLILLSQIVVPSAAKADEASRLNGKILLQVEDKGKAWYIDSETGQRAYLGRPADAFKIMRELGLGISEETFVSFNGKAPKKFSGKILLRVKAKGEAYYVDTETLELHYLGRPADAFNVMRNEGLGITDQNLNKIPVFQKYKEQIEKNTDDIISLNKKIVEQQKKIEELNNKFNNETKSSSSAAQCLEDKWVCSDWGNCLESGIQKRLCSILQECSGVNTPSPVIEQSCTPPTNQSKQIPTNNPPKVSYSIFTPQYTIERINNHNFYIHFTHTTSRIIVLKKMALRLSEPIIQDPSYNVSFVKVGTRVTGSASGYFDKVDDTTYSMISADGIRIDAVGESFGFWLNSANENQSVIIDPDFSQWEIWDQTENLPVKIE